MKSHNLGSFGGELGMIRAQFQPMKIEIESYDNILCTNHHGCKKFTLVNQAARIENLHLSQVPQDIPMKQPMKIIG